jgi:hypothetical protein
MSASRLVEKLTAGDVIGKRGFFSSGINGENIVMIGSVYKCSELFVSTCMLSNIDFI